MLWFALGVMVGGCVGWWAKKVLTVNLVRVVFSYNHWLVYLGRRIVARRRSRETALAVAEKIAAELGGHFDAEASAEDQRQPGLAAHAERTTQTTALSMLAAGRGAERSP